MSYVLCEFCNKPLVDGGHALCASRWQLQQAAQMELIPLDQQRILDALIIERDPAAVTNEACPRCNGQLLLQYERLDTGWVAIPTCLQCSHQVYQRPTESLEDIEAQLRALQYSEVNTKRTVRA